MILAVVLQTRSVGRAAERLGLSQPTVSRALGQLRGLLSDPLLVRSGGTMTLTHRAVELAKPLEDWMAAATTILSPAAFDAQALQRRFVIAASDYGMMSIIGPMIARLRTLAPHCHIDAVSYSHDMFHRMAAGEVDMVVHGFEPDRSVAHARALFRETQSLIVREGHPLTASGSSAVSLDDYLAWPHIAITIGADGHDHVAQCLGDRAPDRCVLARVPYFLAAPDLIGDTGAIVTMPTRAAARFERQPGFVRLPAPIEIADFDYWALIHERSVRDQATQWLIDRLADGGNADRTGPIAGILPALSSPA